jgi:hypothetical protein
MSVSPENHRQFVEFIKLQVFDDGFLDRREEKEILEKGIQLGISIESGLAIITQLAGSKGFVVERLANERAKQILTQFAHNDGKIDKKEFDDAVALYQSDTKGKVREDEVRRRIKQLILDHQWKVKEGGFFGTKWFSAIT